MAAFPPHRVPRGKFLLTRPHTSLGFSSVTGKISSTSWTTGTREPKSTKALRRFVDDEYGYEKQWHPLRTKVDGAGGSHLGICLSTNNATDEWRSSIRYIDPGYRACNDSDWKPSVRPIQPTCDRSDSEHWRPAVRVFQLSECQTEDDRLNSGRRHISPPRSPERIWRSSRGTGVPPTSNWCPAFISDTSQITKLKPQRKEVPEYGENHPQEHFLFDDAPPNRPRFPNVGITRAKEMDYLKKHTPSQILSSVIPASGRIVDEVCEEKDYRLTRQYIPRGNVDHFENGGCVVKEEGHSPRRLRRDCCSLSPQHRPASQRNVIIGSIEDNDEIKPRNSNPGHCLLAPASNYNKDIIDHVFTGEHEQQKNGLEPEIPSYSSQLWKNSYLNNCKGYLQNYLKNNCAHYNYRNHQ